MSSKEKKRGRVRFRPQRQGERSQKNRLTRTRLTWAERIVTSNFHDLMS